MTGAIVIDPSPVVLWGLVAVMALITVWKKGWDGVAAGLRGTWQLLKSILPLVLFAMLAASLLTEIMPTDLIGDSLGEQSGFTGIAMAGVVGGLVPSGPFVSYPIALTLLNSGAGLPQLVAFVTGWSVFALHRVFALEIPLMGLRFTIVRMSASLFLPLIAGAIAYVLWPYFSGI